MIFLMYFGGIIFFPGSVNLIADDDAVPERLTLNTIIFHTFILMNLFNMINCRQLDSAERTEMNIFKTILNNPIFWVVFAIEKTLQHLMVTVGATGLGKAFLKTSSLTPGMTATCWSLGAFSLVMNLVIKQIPIEYFNFTAGINIETEDERQYINKAMKFSEERYTRVVRGV
jgi:Ca2+-transporting ATPase